MKTIGKLAQSLNLNVETIRFYEREGLITQPEKPISGYRQYDETIAGQLRFITKAKALGFTLREIKSLMSMDSNCAQVELLNRQKLAIIRDKINDLRHEATSRLFEKGFTPMQVASITGHKDLNLLSLLFYKHG